MRRAGAGLPGSCTTSSGAPMPTHTAVAAGAAPAPSRTCSQTGASRWGLRVGSGGTSCEARQRGIRTRGPCASCHPARGEARGAPCCSLPPVKYRKDRYMAPKSCGAAGRGRPRGDESMTNRAAPAALRQGGSPTSLHARWRSATEAAQCWKQMSGPGNAPPAGATGRPTRRRRRWRPTRRTLPQARWAPPASLLIPRDLLRPSCAQSACRESPGAPLELPPAFLTPRAGTASQT